MRVISCGATKEVYLVDSGGEQTAVSDKDRVQIDRRYVVLGRRQYDRRAMRDHESARQGDKASEIRCTSFVRAKKKPPSEPGGEDSQKESPARGVIPPRGAPVPAEASLLLRHCCAGNGNAAPQTRGAEIQGKLGQVTASGAAERTRRLAYCFPAIYGRREFAEAGGLMRV